MKPVRHASQPQAGEGGPPVARQCSAAPSPAAHPGAAPAAAASSSALRGCFVTGTDTEVGKTRVSAALLHWLGAHGRRAAGLKPVAAGCVEIAGERVNEDVRALRDAGSVSVTDDEVGPCRLATPCAPHVAAALEGRTIDRRALLAAAHALAPRADVLVIEGVGGFMVPLGDDWDSADLAVAFDLPVVLVVGLRLGCLSHALLTAEAVRSRGLPLLGWVGNTVAPGMPWWQANVDTLRREMRRRHGAPCLGVVPWLRDPQPQALASHFDHAALRAAFDTTA